MKGSKKKEKETTKKGNNGRSSEKRRERSKVAARQRRSVESDIHADLALSLPLPESVKAGLDKASVMRLSLCDLKLRGLITTFFKTNNESSGKDSGQGYEASVINAIGGFLVVISTDGDITYVSENIVTYLGLAQCELMGQSIYEYSHPCDHSDIKELLVSNKGEEVSSIRSGFFRLKCTLTSRGRSVHLRAATYKVINCTGRLFMGGANDPRLNSYVGICEPLPHPSDIDIPLNKQTFLSRHNPDMTCEYVDDSVELFLRYKPEDMVGKSIFRFHHAADSHIVGKAYKSLCSKGQIRTERYRFLCKHGGWIWVVTLATCLNDSNWLKPTAIVCLHFVTSGIENGNDIVSDVQIPVETIPKPSKSICAKPNKRKGRKPKIQTEKENLLPPIIANPGELSSPTPSTAKIFAPRTEDMDSGFLMPCDKDNTSIYSKDGEPEDLTHLAPIAGDDCVSLNVPLLDDLLKSFDQSKVEYSINGSVIDVNSDASPSIFSGVPNFQDNGYTSESSPGMYNESPLFLNSDPLMCLPNSEAKQLAESFESTNGQLSSMDDIQYANSTFQTFTPVQQGTAYQIENPGNCLLPIVSPSTGIAQLADEHEDLQVFGAVAPYSPCPFLSEKNSKAVIGRVENENQSSNKYLSEHTTGHFNLELGDKGASCIEIGNNAKLKMDILSILSERKAGDFPKVVTSLIFGGPEPPIKLKKSGFVFHQELKSGDISNSHFNMLEEPSYLIPNNSNIAHSTNTFPACIQGTKNVQDLAERNLEQNGRMDNSQKRQASTSLDWFARKRNSMGRLLWEESLSLSELTRQDYEVNAPLEDSALLQGHELLTALDIENSNDYIPIVS